MPICIKRFRTVFNSKAYFTHISVSWQNAALFPIQSICRKVILRVGFETK